MEQGRQQPSADALVDADAQRAGGALGQCFHVGLRSLELGDDRVGVAEQQPARVRQRDGPRPTRALDQPLADDLLELRDLLADRRLRVAELPRGTAERPGARERLQGRQMAQLHPQPTIRFHNRLQF